MNVDSCDHDKMQVSEWIPADIDLAQSFPIVASLICEIAALVISNNHHQNKYKIIFQ